MLPEYLIHYYERAGGPFLSFSDLPPEQAETVLEERIRAQFAGKGGRPQREPPLYFVLGGCDWCR